MRGPKGGPGSGNPTDPEVGQLQGHLDEAVRREAAAFDEALAKMGEGEDVAVDVSR